MVVFHFQFSFTLYYLIIVDAMNDDGTEVVVAEEECHFYIRMHRVRINWKLFKLLEKIQNYSTNMFIFF